MARRVHLDEVRTWPSLVSMSQAAAALGIAEKTAYNYAHAGTFPVPIVMVGSLRKVPTIALIRLLAAQEHAREVAGRSAELLRERIEEMRAELDRLQAEADSLEAAG